MNAPLLKDKYSLAGCCHPTQNDSIVGYFSFDDHIKVHRDDCANLAKAAPERIVKLDWTDILALESVQPDRDYQDLDETDFAILKHHRDFDIDYSLKVAQVLGIEKQEAFDRHQKLRQLGLLERVEALIVQYRKKIAKNKWIKHRNHTYYQITKKGAGYLTYHSKKNNP